jgi:hypothetical protein
MQALGQCQGAPVALARMYRARSLLSVRASRAAAAA